MSGWVSAEPMTAKGARVVGFDLVDVVRLLWSVKWRIAGCTLLGFVIAAAIAYRLPKYYVAQGEVVVRAEASVAPDSDHAYYSSVVNEAVVATERHVMVAEGLLSRVAREVEFPPQVDAPGLVSVWMARAREALHLPPASDTARLDRDAAHLVLLQDAVSTSVDKDSSVITLRASTTDAKLSAAIVNQLLRRYMEDRIAAQQETAHNVQIALQARLRQTTDQIREAEEHISGLMQQPNLIEGTEIPEAQRGLTLLTNQLVQARRTQADKQAAYDAAVRLRDSAGGDPVRLSELLDGGATSTSDLRRELVQKQQALAMQTARYGRNFPDRVATQGEVDLLTRRITGEATRLMAQRRAELDAANQVVATLSGQFGHLRNEASQESSAILKLSRERESLSNLRRQAGSIEERLTSVAAQPVDPNARILTRANVPLLAAYPNKPLLGILGAVFGFTLSSGVSLGMAFTRRMRLSVVEQAELLPGRLLGSIPRLFLTRRSRQGLLERVRQLQHNASDVVDIAFQGAALEVEDAVLTGAHRVVTITSALPHEGKSTVAMALGLKLARAGRRVLLMHTDLRFGREQYFAQGTTQSVSVPTRLPGVVVDEASSLNILELGVEARPIDFLQSDAFRGVLRTARQDYDLVICDTPPVLSFPDGLLVARLSDAVILVSEFKQTASEAEIAELSRRIVATGKPVCGVIVTKVDQEESGYAAYQGYHSVRNGGRLLAGASR